MLVDNDPNLVVVFHDRLIYLNLVLILVLWAFYIVLFAYTMTKWKVLRYRPEILGATILVFVLSSASIIIYIPPRIRHLMVDGLTDLALESNGAPGVAFVDQVLGALSNMIADLILVYRLWIIMGDSKHRIWVAVPVATAVLGTGLVILNNTKNLVAFSRDLVDGSLTFGIFLQLCTNAMATTALSYYIWKETRYEFAPSMPNKIRLRRVAMGLIETGFIYFAVQFSYFIVIAIGWYEWTHGSNQPSVDLWWAEEVTNALFAVIPGIATTLIAAKINISSVIIGRQDLITEVFAPWRSKSRPGNTLAVNARDATLSAFKAEVFALPYSTNITQDGLGEHVAGSEEEDPEKGNDKMREEMNDSPC